MNTSKHKTDLEQKLEFVIILQYLGPNRFPQTLRHFLFLKHPVSRTVKTSQPVGKPARPALVVTWCIVGRLQTQEWGLLSIIKVIEPTSYILGLALLGDR